MYWERFQAWAKTHARLISYVTASLLVSLWTLLRFYTARTIFDLVGQQVLAGQWLHGNVSGSVVGVTNYLPKIFLLYMPLHVLPGSPRLKLIALTLVVNIATIVLLGLVLERLLRLYKIRVGGALWAAVLWLSAIAGSVFWIQFTNSRNLEVVGGLLLLYLGLRYLEAPSNKALMIIAAYCSVLFFADTLQLYMTGLPLLLYAAIAWRKTLWKQVLPLGLALAVGFIGSKVLFFLFSHALHIQFQQVGGSGLMLSAVGSSITNAAKALVHLYAGGADAGKLREVVNVAFLALGFAGVAYGLWRKLVSRAVVGLVSCVLFVDIAAYIASGQAQQAGTERYLIMTVPAVMLLLASLQVVWQKFRYLAVSALGIVLLVNFVQLGGQTVNANHHFVQDAHLESVGRYADNNRDVLLYASNDTAISLTYLHGADRQNPLPLRCVPGQQLQKTNLFFSKTAYTKHEQVIVRQIGIVLDGTAITNVPNVCAEQLVEQQLGLPVTRDYTDDNSVVLLYPSTVQAKLHY